MALIGLHGVRATLAHFAAVWGVALSMLPRMKLSPPPNEWGKEELAIDAVHHLVYAGATTVAFGFLDRRIERARLAA